MFENYYVWMRLLCRGGWERTLTKTARMSEHKLSRIVYISSKTWIYSVYVCINTELLIERISFYD